MHPILEKHLPQIEQACQAANVRRLFVFGSVLTDRFGEESDVDFIAEFAPMTPEDYADHYFLLCEELEAILQRPVDVITPAGIRNPIFRIELEKHRRLLYSLPAA
jgi:predicted nucleotidyltransferase